LTSTIIGDLINPWSIFVTIQGDIFVDNGHSNNRIDKWTLNATNSKQVMNVNGSCTGIFVSSTNSLYCSSIRHHRVIKIELDSTFTIPINVAGTGCPGPVANMLNHPHGIYIDINSNLYVADSHNNRIQNFSPDQLNATTVAGFGAIVYFILNRPTGIVFDADGYLYIVDSGNHRIIQSTLDGFRCLVGCSGESGITSSQLNNPQTMAFDNNGNIFVTDFNNYRIQKFLLHISKCGTSIYFRSG
jgi:DNA-binding beta-propeller fold protein YncE